MGENTTPLNIEQIRKDFVILDQQIYGNKPLVYLDSGATAQKPMCVIEAVDNIHKSLNANVHRGVHYLAEQSTMLYEQARGDIAKFIGSPSVEQVIFTAGATASINLVAYAWCDKFVGEGDNIVVSQMEHHSNIVPWQMAAERRGATLRVLPIDERGDLKMEMVGCVIDERTKVVAITQASNTLGTMPELRPIIDAAHAVGAVVMVDGCQGVVHSKVDVVEMGCDFYAFSAHKLYGPTGCGVLYGRRELLEMMPPFMGGGDMVKSVTFEKTIYGDLPLKFEAGTSNYIGAIGLGAAIQYLNGLDRDAVHRHEQQLLSYATEQLQQIEGLRIYGNSETKCSIVSFGVEGVHNYDIGMILDKLGVAIRTGHHCAQPVMDFFGVRGMCRASFAMYNTMGEIDTLCEALQRAVKMLR